MKLKPVEGYDQTMCMKEVNQYQISWEIIICAGQGVSFVI